MRTSCLADKFLECTRDSGVWQKARVPDLIQDDSQLGPSDHHLVCVIRFRVVGRSEGTSPRSIPMSRTPLRHSGCFWYAVYTPQWSHELQALPMGCLPRVGFAFCPIQKRRFVVGWHVAYNWSSTPMGNGMGAALVHRQLSDQLMYCSVSFSPRMGRTFLTYRPRRTRLHSTI